MATALALRTVKLGKQKQEGINNAMTTDGPLATNA